MKSEQVGHISNQHASRSDHREKLLISNLLSLLTKN